MIDHILQWTGTAAIISMYVIMSFFPELYPINIVLGLLGGVLFLAWSIRVNNRPQMFVNLTGISVCLAGIFKYWG